MKYSMFRGNLPYRLLGQNLYPLHRFRLSKSRHRFPRNTLTLISHIITTGSPVLLSDIVTDVATNRIYTGFSPHLHCRSRDHPYKGWLEMRAISLATRQRLKAPQTFSSFKSLSHLTRYICPLKGLVLLATL